MDQHATTDNRYTQVIADFVAGLRYKAIPAEVIARSHVMQVEQIDSAASLARLLAGAG